MQRPAVSGKARAHATRPKVCYNNSIMTNGFLSEEEAPAKKQYRRSLWWIEHRQQLKKAALGVWIAIDAFMLVSALWMFADAFLISYTSEQRAVAEMAVLGQTELRSYARATSAQDLSFDKPSAFDIGGSRYDLFTTLTNPNADWYAEYEYFFTVGEVAMEPVAGFILPGGKKPIASLAYDSETRPQDVTFTLQNVQWHRVDPHEIADYAIWSAERLNLIVQDVNFSTDLVIDDKTIGRVTFSVKNQTAYSYWEPVFYILFKRGDGVVGVTRTTLPQFEAGQTREVVVNWLDLLPAATKVEVYTDLNIFDVETYMPLTGEQPSDTRTRVLE